MFGGGVVVIIFYFAGGFPPFFFFLKKIIRPIKDILNLIEATLKGSDRRWHLSLLGKLTLIKLCVLQQTITDSWPSRKVWTIGSGKSGWCVSSAPATAKWEPRHAGLGDVRASRRQRLQWEWGSSQSPQDQPGIFLPTGWWRKAATWQQRNSMALPMQLLSWVTRKWRNAADPHRSACMWGACSRFCTWRGKQEGPRLTPCLRSLADLPWWDLAGTALGVCQLSCAQDYKAQSHTAFLKYGGGMHIFSFLQKAVKSWSH